MRLWALVLFLGACGSGVIERSPSLPRRPTVYASPSPEPTAEAVSPCERSTVGAGLVPGEGATGHTWLYLIVFNRGATACTVMGPPKLELRDDRDRLVSHSGDRMPWVGRRTNAGRLVLDPGTSPASWQGSATMRPAIAFASVAQGRCPGGVFPRGGRLVLILPGIDPMRVDGFEGDLPHEYRCDLAADQVPPADRATRAPHQRARRPAGSDLIGLPDVAHGLPDRRPPKSAIPIQVRSG